MFYDKIKKFYMPAGDAKYKGIDSFLRKMAATLSCGVSTLAF